MNVAREPMPQDVPLSSLAVVRRRCRTILWFLRRPRLYPHLLDLVSRRLFSANENEQTRAEALKWCGDLSRDTTDAIARLTGGSRHHEALQALFPDVFRYGRQRESASPGSLGGPGDLDLLYHVAEHLRAMRVVETGVGFGWSSLAILLSLKNRPGSILCSSDRPVHEGNYDAYTGCAVPPDLRHHWRIFNWADKQALPKALKAAGVIDMCHYDSDKTYAGRMWAYPRLWKALRPGGVFVSDDIDDNVAFRDFALHVGCEPIVIRLADKDIGEKYVGVLVKSSNGTRHTEQPVPRG